LRSSLSLFILCFSDQLAQSLSSDLGDDSFSEKPHDRYVLNLFRSEEEFLDSIQQRNHPIDCLILEQSPNLKPLLKQLQQQAILFPTIVLQSNSPADLVANSATASELVQPDLKTFYHSAMIQLPVNQLSQIGLVIDQAINQFIQIPSASQRSHSDSADSAELEETRTALVSQQLRLAEKLKERLGYLGVYYKRNPQNFLRHMNYSQREELLQQLKADYREIVLYYFSSETDLNEKIDNFVNIAFFADVPVSQIVEIHMELMDEFSKQLKLEGRSDEMLLDYRLTLIDTIAHLCEMYRRSIPRES
jgi:circadian clock protein KaiA